MTQDRAEFEAWAIDPARELNLHTMADNNDYYSNRVTRTAWESWQAAKVSDASPGDYTEGRKRLHAYLDENHDVIPLTDDLSEIERIVLSYAGRASEAAQQAEAEPVELSGVAAVLEDGDGWWQTCSGCHDSIDGHSAGEYPHSKILGCTIGAGCHECGGIGAIWFPWTEEDAELMMSTAKDEGDQTTPAPVVPDNSRRLARGLLLCAAVRSPGSYADDLQPVIDALSSSPQPATVPEGYVPVPAEAIREVIRISDRQHPAWDAVKGALSAAQEGE